MAAAAAFVAVAACSPAARELSWQARFADPELEPRARALEVEIRADGCDGAAIWSLAFAPSDPPSDMGPPELGPGTYGFAIAARDASCTRFAIGCTALELPQEPGASVVVTLEAFLGGAACGAGQCADGLCGMPDGGVPDGGGTLCPAGRGDCNLRADDGCETPLDTVDACGACGVACELEHATPACSAGSCSIAACDEGWADCNAVAADGCETSLRSTDHCGACGTICQLANAVESCASMRCELVSCYAGWGDCDASVGNGCEASLITATDCGACAAACTDPLLPLCGVGAASGARECVATCAAPAPTQCGSACVDTSADAQHCGGCGVGCRVDHAEGVCAASVCGVGACDVAWADCNGVATDGCERATTTIADCGACGVACAATTARVSCPLGTCVVDACDEGLGDCDGSGTTGCEADLAAPSTCGSCDETCTGGTSVCGRDPSGERACLAACAPPDPDRCGDRCFDTSSDVANCGGCGLACALPNAATACSGGECVVGGCLAGFADCDRIDANGCEARTTDDPASCGGCGIECPARDGASAACVGSECTYTCEAGFGDCDGDEANGCERGLGTPTDCGACGRACDPPNAIGACEGGACRITGCDAGFGDCDGSAANGCEATLVTDRQNCGMCGMRCSGPTRDCCSGTCGSCG